MVIASAWNANAYRENWTSGIHPKTYEQGCQRRGQGHIGLCG